ncbi:DNA repair protein RadA [Fibrobacter intestinalis]|uniref:DNA repair protein RadA n=1 Tax=Fibrobacter intestinalis TaxID=28122 RepID=A0A1T4JY69_9BACT|nr:DNA repair protein RadA [Fibrobacter intestinalis]SJZ35074.1 DNA repair protein RadA/Sms [Fibrobacter intestinalis]
MKAETEFVCTECGEITPKWAGKCPNCGSWSTLVERAAENKSTRRGLGRNSLDKDGTAGIPRRLADIQTTATQRLSSASPEFDRTLGGGFAPGSLVLIGGDPGIGKSTLVLQTMATMASAGVKALYVSGEESAVQVKLRSERLGVSGSDLMLLCETNLDRILEKARAIEPEIMVIDSIQTIYNAELPGTPGSVSQLRESTLSLMVFAKNANCITILIGHVTKDGQIAGPRILEHMVDTVAYFEGDRNNQYRILRTIKNRFGATDEIGVFEMTSGGLVSVTNPSKIFLDATNMNSPGSVVSCTIEGSRAMLFETQALVNQTNYAVAQRVAAGIDPKRLTIILALLDKFGGIPIGNSDVFASIAGGLKINDTGTDLAIALAIVCNHLGITLPPKTIVIGELGLSGEIRSVSQTDLRVKEAERLGFEHILLPASSKVSKSSKIDIRRFRKLDEAIEFVRGG